MAKDVVRSGVTFDREIYKRLDSIVNDSKRYKIDKSEIINAILENSNLTLKDIQKLVMGYREKK